MEARNAVKAAEEEAAASCREMARQGRDLKEAEDLEAALSSHVCLSPFLSGFSPPPFHLPLPPPCLILPLRRRPSFTPCTSSLFPASFLRPLLAALPASLAFPPCLALECRSASCIADKSHLLSSWMPCAPGQVQIAQAAGHPSGGDRQRLRSQTFSARSARLAPWWTHSPLRWRRLG